MAKKTIKIYVLFSFLLGFSHAFFFATYQLFLVSRGMNLLEINIINMFYMAGVFLLEVPTGAFADVFGRKRSIVSGCFALSLSVLVYYFGNSLLMFITAELVGALGATLLSGALEAWVVDSLREHNYDGEIAGVFRKEAYLGQLGIILASLMGGYIGKIDLALPWLVSAVATFGTGIFAWVFLKENFQKAKGIKLDFTPIKNTIHDSVAFGYQNKSVWFVILFGAILSMSVQGMNMQWPLVFQNSYGLTTDKLGWLFAAMSLSIMLGGKISKLCTKLIKKEKDAIILSQLVTVFGMIGASLMLDLPVMLGFFLVHEMGRGVLNPLKQVYLNHRIPSRQRATILSFDSMIGRSGSFLGLLGTGYLAQMAGIPLTWLASGCFLAIGIVVCLNLKNGD